MSFPEPATEPVVLNATKPSTVNASPVLGTLREARIRSRARARRPPPGAIPGCWASCSGAWQIG